MTLVGVTGRAAPKGQFWAEDRQGKGRVEAAGRVAVVERDRCGGATESADLRGGQGAIWVAKSPGRERALVVVEGEPAQRVEVTGHAGGDLGRVRGHRRRRAGRAPGRVPSAGRGQRLVSAAYVRATTPTASSAGGLRRVEVLVAGHRRGGGHAADLDGAVVGAQDRVRGQAQVVQAARRGRPRAPVAVSPAIRRASSAGSAALLEELGEGVGVGEGLLDEEGDALGAADVQDAHEAVVVDAGGAAGGVEGGVGVGVVARRRQRRRRRARASVSWADQRSALRQLLEPTLHGIPAARAPSKALRPCTLPPQVSWTRAVCTP